MKYTSLLNDIDKTFLSFRKPSIIYNIPADGDIIKGEYLAIQNDFGGISREAMTDEQCSMMLIDGPLISDEALCYFIPRLARSVFHESGNEYLLYRRLEKLNKNLLSPEQKEVLNYLITSLKALEQEMEMEEETKLEKAQMDWELEMEVSQKLEDKLLLAIARGNIDHVKNLIDQGANINKKDNYGNSPLDIANYKGHIKIIELLKQAGTK